MTAGSEATIRQLTVDQDQNTRDRTQPRPPVAWIWAGIILVVAIVFATVYFVLTLPKDANIAGNLSVSVASVSGMTWPEAKKKLTAQGLAPQEVTERSASVDQGKVIRTDPRGGTKVGSAQAIQVFVSAGPDDVNIPDLSGYSITEGKKQLTQFGLTYGSTSRQDSATVRKDVIISTTPDAGSPATAGETVSFIISTGMVNVPSVVGLDAAAAGSKLAALQLDVTVLTDNSCSGKKVTTQSLPAGEQPQKSKISITVCSS